MDRRARLDAYVSETVRYAPRKREGRWIVTRQVRKADGRWYAQLSTQEEAKGADDALERATTSATAERKRGEKQRGD
jgi:hypothetical protein